MGLRRPGATDREPRDWDPGRTADLLAEHGLGATVVPVMGPGRDLVATDAGAVGRTQEFLRGCVDAAVADAGYDGPRCIESFTPDNASITRAASIWRPLERSQDAIATDGLRFLRALLG